VIEQTRGGLGRLAGILDPVTRGWLVLSSGSVARLGLGFIASVVIARALGPAAFGVYAVLATVAALGGALADLGLTTATVRRVAPLWESDPERAKVVWRVFFWLRLLITSALVAVGVAVAGPLASLLFDDPGRTGLLRLALLGIAATALSGSVTGMLQATGHFGRLSAVLIVNSGLTALLAIALVLAGQLTIATALLVLGIGTSLVSFALGFRLLPGEWPFRPPGRERFRRDGTALIRFGTWLWLGGVFSLLALYLDVLLVNHWTVAATVGTYALAVNLAVKVEVVNHSLYTVLLPDASRLRAGLEVRSYLRRSLLRSGAISLALLPLIPLAGPLITIIYGSEYAGAVGLFQGLLAIAILNVLVMPVLMLAFTFDRPKLVALGDGVRVVTLVIAGIALIPAIGVNGAVLAKLLAALLGSGVVVSLLVQHARTDAQRAVESN
jgi:O-antigen/teichoic acid export membrane protein